ncbi:hypothetical protein [Streptococcus ovis]|uniref:hypothetical protein n=1 Tax=Streptococcus ovis TaxID=82806 RepID=UPI00035DF3CF|nr:hypothetical protein [Streptococcus ovis]
MLPYPISYFSNIIIARRIFSGRTHLRFWQKLLTTIFLISLLLIPNAIHISQLKTYPLETIVDGIYTPFSNTVMENLKTVQLDNHTLSQSGKNSSHVYFGNKSKPTRGISYQFGADKVTIRKDETELAKLSYQILSTEDFQSKNKLTSAISQTWFLENRVSASFLLLGISAVLITFNTLLLIIGVSAILYLVSRTKFFDFKNFGESYTFTLNCLGIPSLLACLSGLFSPSSLSVIMVQNVLFVLLLTWVFYKTHFQEER